MLIYKTIARKLSIGLSQMICKQTVKNQFMLLSSCDIDVGNMCLYVGENLLSPEPCVRVLGVTVLADYHNFKSRQ